MNDEKEIEEYMETNGPKRPKNIIVNMPNGFSYGYSDVLSALECCFKQACSVENGKYDNQGLGNYEYAQKVLIQYMRINKEDCIRNN